MKLPEINRAIIANCEDNTIRLLMLKLKENSSSICSIFFVKKNGYYFQDLNSNEELDLTFVHGWKYNNNPDLKIN